MAYTVKDCILEIKRRTPIGNTKQPVPDELDILAFINRVLNTIHNYGVYQRSPKLLQDDTLYTDKNGVIETTKVIQQIKDIYIKKDKLTQLVPFYSVDYETILNTEEPLAYKITGTYTGSEMKIVANPGEGATIHIVYYPVFEPLTERSETLPYSPELFNVIVDYTMALMTGSNKSVDDIDMIPKNCVGVISQYFRDIDGRDKIVAEGPW